MTALNIREIGEDRKAALDSEAANLGISTSELVRRLIDRGIQEIARDREQTQWIEEARTGLENEGRHLASSGPTLARYRLPLTGARD